MKIFQKYRGKIILRRIFAVSFGLAAVCILLSCILGFGWFRVSQIQQQESDYENRMDTYVLVLQNYGKSMENVVTVLENDVYICKLINRNTFAWDSTTGIAAQEVTNLVSVNPIDPLRLCLARGRLSDQKHKSLLSHRPERGCADAGYFPDEHVSRECGHSISGYLRKEPEPPLPDQRIDGSHHWGQTQRHPSQHGSRQDHDLNSAEDGGGTVPAD